jgi:uncharacterized protein (TIGR02145 family)
MKRICLLLVVFFAFAKVQSQSYLISYNASGASTTVESVFVENLTQGTSLTLDGTDVLELQLPTAINTVEESNNGLQISPNPMTSKCNVAFDLLVSAQVTVDIIDVSGKIVVTEKAKLSSGTQTVEISNLKQGFYSISVSFNKNVYNGKIISNNITDGKASISFSMNSNLQIELTNRLKSLKSNVSMQYHSGDNLRYTGSSGSLTAIILDSPTANKTITFSFTQPTTLASISTSAISNISQTTASSGGTISSNGGATITASGVCWSTTQNPTTTNSKTTDGTATGSFTSLITGLTANTTYYVRAYATNSAGTAYGNEISFKTLDVILPNTVVDFDGNVYNTVTIGTQVWMGQNLKVTKYNDGTAIPLEIDGLAWGHLNTAGYCWINNNQSTYGATYGAYYNWYAVATDKLCPSGWHVPTDAEWTTLTTSLGGEGIAGGPLKEMGTVHWTTPNTSATNSTGFSGLPAGSRSIAGVYSTQGQFGSMWSSTAGTSTGNAIYRSLGNARETVYRGEYNKTSGYSVRCLSDNQTTPATLPVISTTAVSSILSTSAISGGNISSTGNATITSSGICWSTATLPTTANSKTIVGGTTVGSFSNALTGLVANTKYYVRAYATNSVGTAYGTELFFTTSMQSTGSNISDIEGTIYNTVTIGTQVWMAENLKTSKYNDGSVIPIITDASVWSNRTTAAVSDYNNTPSNSAIYGKLYNWYAVNTSKICPSGWHVPSQVEWNSMESYLIANGFNYDATTVDNKIGKALTSTSGWSVSTFVGTVGYNQTSNNSSGLNLIPGPSCSYDGTFGPIDYRADYWSSTTVGIDRAWGWSIHYQTSAGTWSDYYKNVGLPIRCLKD